MYLFSGTDISMTASELADYKARILGVPLLYPPKGRIKFGSGKKIRSILR